MQLHNITNKHKLTKNERNGSTTDQKTYYQGSVIRVIENRRSNSGSHSAPNAVKILDSWDKKQSGWDKYYPASVKRGIERLWRKGLVEIIEDAQGATVKITTKGKTELLRFDLANMKIVKPQKWDQKWRMVFFDIPKGHNKVRNWFRDQLKNLGFFQMQKSVYIYPYPCGKEMRFLREILEVPHNVKLATIENLENDEDLRKIFHLPHS